MCGRTASTLNKESIISATAYRDDITGQYIRYEWLESSKDSYEPNFNQTRGNRLPLLVSKKFIDKTCNESKTKVLTSMVWGLKPDWIKSDDNNSNLNPINCRFETICEKKMFESALKNGRRSVVFVDGFFEWKTTNKTKDPFFLYLPQKYIDYKKDVKIWSENQTKLSEENEWKGPRLLPMAAIFNKSGDNYFSFSIITVPMHSSLVWLHNRMPAILPSNESINDWIDSERVSTTKALQMLVPFGGLQYHRVSSLVSNVRNNSIENILVNKSKTTQKTIDHWFPTMGNKKSLKKEIKEENEEIDVSKAKRLKE